MSYKRFLINKKVIILSSLVVFVSVSCSMKVPIKVMSRAKTGITRADEVKADKYAPEELKKAQDELLKSHEYAVKDEDAKKAQESAENSVKNSKLAVEKSLPLLARDTLAEANEIYQEAIIANAEEYAAEDFFLADEKIGEAESLLKRGSYWESYLKSKEAAVYAANAKDKALQNASALQEKIDSMRSKVTELEFLGGREIAPDELDIAGNNINGAAASLEEKNLKDASVKIADAEEALKTAEKKIWEKIASDKIRAAEEALADLQSSPDADKYTDELGKAASLLGEGRELYTQEFYKEAAAKADEALEVLDSVAIAMETMIEEEKIEKEVEAAETEAPRVIEYVVKYNPEKRDCLWRIALNIYKDARLWPLIYMANIDKIKDPDLIFPGQKFVIPPVPKREELKKSGAESAQPEEGLPETKEAAEQPDEAVMPETPGTENTDETAGGETD